MQMLICKLRLPGLQDPMSINPTTCLDQTYDAAINKPTSRNAHGQLEGPDSTIRSLVSVYLSLLLCVNMLTLR